MRQSDAKKAKHDIRDKLRQELNALDIFMSDEDEISAKDIKGGDRADVSPPPLPDDAGTYDNPDGLIDILTFCEHPYFLNLKLTPWQRIIVKTFYSGTTGNSHLGKFEDERPEDPESCVGCVWQYVKNNELEHFKSIKSTKGDPALWSTVKPTLMLEENSPCLSCSRFKEEMREARYDFSYKKARTDKQKAEIDILRNRDIEDRFTTEMDLLNDDKITDKVRNQIKNKIGNEFQELILVLGRRSGKSFLVSIITLYEVYRFLMMKHPQARFPLLEFDVITILNVAVNEATAKAAIFDKIKSLATTSPYFQSYISPTKPPTQLEMFFVTDYDKEENKRRVTNGQPPMDGTIQLMSGHSNSSGLVGRTAAVIIIDEMAEMANANAADGGGTDDSLYAKLKPSIATFGRQGKIICISNPLGPHGRFFELYNASFDDETTLMFQLATWQANPNIEKSYLKAEELKDPKNFPVFYGAQFGNAITDPFIPVECIDNAFARGDGRMRAEKGHDLLRYYLHLDPAYNSDYYALALVHTEPSHGQIGHDGRLLMRVVVDHMHFWQPKGKNEPIKSEEVEAYILELDKKFRINQISYDNWNSQSSVAKLRSHGLNVVVTPFIKQYKDQVYGEIYELFVKDLIDFYNIDSPLVGEVTEAKKQFKHLHKRFAGKTPKIEAAKDHHDDIPDAVASAAFQALKSKVFGGLARPQAFRSGLR